MLFRQAEFNKKEEKKLNGLWASYIHNFSFDLYQNEVSIKVVATVNKMEKHYHLRFSKIVDLHFFDYLPSSFNGEENVLEITEIHFSKKNDNYFFEIIIWDEDKMLEVECKQYSLEMYKEVDLKEE